MKEGIFDKFKDATVEDIIADPHKFGAPSFEEYAANREHYKGARQQWFAAIDRSSEVLRQSRRLKRQYYILNGYRFDTLEALEVAATNMGLKWWKLQPKPQVIDLGGGWCDLKVVMEDPSVGDQTLAKPTSIIVPSSYRREH